jgi:hypothetical protein
VSREGEAEVGLGEGGNGAAKHISHGGGHGGLDFDGNESAFMEIYGKTSCRREVIKSKLEVGDVVRDSADDNQSVISILEDRTGEVINQGVKEEAITGGLEKELLEDISNNVEQEGG